MGQFWGLSVNDDMLLRCVVLNLAKQISLCTSNAKSFGLGYYSQGELLQRFEPQCKESTIDSALAIDGIRAEMLVMHMRSNSNGPTKRECIHPFRFKEWLFAHNGSIVGFLEIKDRILNSIPSFIRRNIKAETDSELMFHLFLSFLYDAGELNRKDADIQIIGDALARTLATIDEFAHVEGNPKSDASIIVTNGYSMVTVNRGYHTDYLCLNGILDCPACRITLHPNDPDFSRADHEDLRAVLVRSCKNPVQSTETVKVVDNSILLISKKQEVSVRTF